MIEAREIRVPDPETALLQQEARDIVRKAMERLSGRERFILTKRFTTAITLRELGKLIPTLHTPDMTQYTDVSEYGWVNSRPMKFTGHLCGARVRELECRALRKLKRYLSGKEAVLEAFA